MQKLFDVVYIPKAVYQELAENESFPEEIRIVQVLNKVIERLGVKMEQQRRYEVFDRIYEE